MFEYESFINGLVTYRESIHQNIIDIATFTLIFAVLDILVVPKKSRWFSLHTISNSFTTYYSFPDFFLTWTNPLKSIEYMNWRPLNITVTLHFYHMLFFRNLNSIDWVHHIVMMYVAVYMYLCPLGAPINSVIFFVNGLPGGLDYLLLALVKHKIITPFTEKTINVYLNNWIRAPGIIISTYVAVLLMVRYRTPFDIPHIIPEFIPGHIWIDSFLALLIPIALYWNAQYFNQRVLINFGQRRTERSQMLENEVTDELIQRIKKEEPQEDKKKELAIVKYQVRDTFVNLRAKQDKKDEDEVNQRENHLTHLVSI